MLGAILSILSFAGGFILGTSPVSRGLNYFLNEHYPNAELNPLQIVEAYYRGIIDEKEYINRMKKYGFDESRSKEILKLSLRLLEASELTVAKWRGVISDDEFYKRMRALGFTKEDADKFEQIHKFYPSPSDLVRFAVRDVYNEEIVKKYGYDEDFPERIIDDAKKSGMDEKWIRAYWRAHWNLPSPTQGFEMLHRLNPDVLKVRAKAYEEMGLNPDNLKTDLNTLRELLRIADYPKYWRDRLIAIAYDPLTRVDLRRIYVMGLIDDEELIARLMELGYTKKDAELLAEFYKTLKNAEGRDLTRSMIEKAFKEGMISESEFIEYLKELGYDDDEAKFIAKLVQKKKEDEEIDEKLKAYIYMYKAGKITYDELKQKIDDLPISEARKEYWLAKADLEREKAQKMPSKNDLVKWLKKGIISPDEFRSIMQQLGYSDKFIEYYIKEVR